MLPRVRKLSATVKRYIRPAPHEESEGILAAGLYYRHIQSSNVHSLRSKKIYLEIRRTDHFYRIFCAYIRVLPGKNIFIPYCQHEHKYPTKYRELTVPTVLPRALNYIVRHRWICS